MRSATIVPILLVVAVLAWFAPGESSAQIAKKPDAAAILNEVIAAIPEVRGQDGKPSPTTSENVVPRVRLLAESYAQQQRIVHIVQSAVCGQ